MERVFTVHLNANILQVEEPAYEALKAYLARASAALAGNPDRQEILSDLEQAVADKSLHRLAGSSGVVTGEMMAAVLGEMGPIAAESGADASDGQPGPAQGARATEEGPRRKLYRLRDGAQVAGVCSGLAAYLNIDANLIRVLFAIAVIMTGGFALGIYVAMMFNVPSAHTSEEWASAHGLPFTAQQVIDRARQEYAAFAERSGGASLFQNKGEKSQRRAAEHPAPLTVMGFLARMAAGALALVFTVLEASLVLAVIAMAVLTLSADGVPDWAAVEGIPAWLAPVAGFLLLGAAIVPVSGMRRAAMAALAGRSTPRAFEGDVTTLIVILLAGWAAWTFAPGVEEGARSAFEELRRVFAGKAGGG